MYFSGGLIPSYLLIKDLKLMDTIASMILPTGINIMYMLIISNYFKSLPPALEESAKIDGATDLRILWSVILPLSLPGIVSGITMVFVPAVSTFYISQKLGSTGTTLIGDVIESQFKGAYNPNLGAAMSLAGLPNVGLSGAGTITLALSDHAKKVLGAEIVPEAIDDARENAARNGVKNAEFFCGDASDVAKKLARENLRPDVITVDPPRKGLAADVVESIAEMQPGRVVYVSCDSATMARDVKRFAELGYTVTRAAAVDMFPRADHIEAVCRLERGERD